MSVTQEAKRRLQPQNLDVFHQNWWHFSRIWWLCHQFFGDFGLQFGASFIESGVFHEVWWFSRQIWWSFHQVWWFLRRIWWFLHQICWGHWWSRSRSEYVSGCPVPQPRLHLLRHQRDDERGSDPTPTPGREAPFASCRSRWEMSQRFPWLTVLIAYEVGNGVVGPALLRVLIPAKAQAELGLKVQWERW